MKETAKLRHYVDADAQTSRSVVGDSDLQDLLLCSIEGLLLFPLLLLQITMLTHLWSGSFFLNSGASTSSNPLADWSGNSAASLLEPAVATATCMPNLSTQGSIHPRSRQAAPGTVDYPNADHDRFMKCLLSAPSSDEETAKLQDYADASRSNVAIVLKKLEEANPNFHQKLAFPSFSSARLITMLNQSLNMQHSL